MYLDLDPDSSRSYSLTRHPQLMAHAQQNSTAHSDGNPIDNALPVSIESDFSQPRDAGDFWNATVAYALPLFPPNVNFLYGTLPLGEV